MNMHVYLKIIDYESKNLVMSLFVVITNSRQRNDHLL